MNKTTITAATPKINPSLLLRHNAGMIRDVFVDADPADAEGPMLVIRQTKFAEDGTLGANETKVIRLTKIEADAVIKFWGTSIGKTA